MCAKIQALFVPLLFIAFFSACESSTVGKERGSPTNNKSGNSFNNYFAAINTDKRSSIRRRGRKRIDCCRDLVVSAGLKEGDCCNDSSCEALTCVVKEHKGNLVSRKTNGDCTTSSMYVPAEEEGVGASVEEGCAVNAIAYGVAVDCPADVILLHNGTTPCGQVAACGTDEACYKCPTLPSTKYCIYDDAVFDTTQPVCRYEEDFTCAGDELSCPTISDGLDGELSAVSCGTYTNSNTGVSFACIKTA